MTMSLMARVDDPKLEAVYGWLEQRQGVKVQLFGWEENQRAALLAYGDGAADPFGWSNWVTKVADDPSRLLPVFEQLELVTDDATASVLNATFLGVFTARPQPPPAGG